MKKILALLLGCCLLFALCACEGNGFVETPDAETGALVVTETPATTAAPTVDVKETLGAPILVSVVSHNMEYEAPDGSGRVILSFGYDEAKVYMENDPEAAEHINHTLAVQDELFYSGSGEGDGLNGMLERAIDNFGYVMNEGNNKSVEFSSVRSVRVARGDSRIVCLCYRVNSYTGGAHGTYSDRSLVFDAQSGALLTLDSISTDRTALEQTMLEHMLETVNSDVRYQPILGYLEQFSEKNLSDALRAIIREGRWELNEEGLTVFSDIGELGSYADGVIRFTLPYESLQDLVDERFFPVERLENGELRVLPLSGATDPGLPLVDKITLDADGQELCLAVSGTVYGLAVDSVSYFSDEIGFYQTSTHWYGSYLSNSGLQIKTELPDGMPDLMIRYTDAEGGAHRYLLTQSGEDGSLILMDAESIAAVG